MIEYENLGKLNLPFRAFYLKAFESVLDSGWFILGKSVERFEREFADYLKAPFFLGLASGLDALELSIKVLDLPPNSEILVPSNTYIATVNAILNTGHKPVFVEPDPKTFNIDPKNIEEKITANTKGIMIVHLYGLTCDMDPIMAICKKHNLFLFEDCAQSHGATYKDKTTGTFGDFGAFSFYPTKNLGALGDAGGITVKTEAMYKKMKAFRNYGSHIKYQNEYIGDNSRLDEVQAAFLSIKLKALDEINSHKRKLANLYHQRLDASKFVKPNEPDGCKHVYHIYAIRHPERDRLKQYLLEHDIKTDIHYPIPPCDQNSIKNAFSERGWTIPQDDFVIAREIHKTELSLPVSYIHSEKEILQVIDVLNQF